MRDPNTRTLTLAIDGMSCSHCQQRVQNALENVQSIHEAHVNLDEGHATLQATPDANVDDIVRAVDAAGYSATPR